jgi:hypothetical protein
VVTRRAALLALAIVAAPALARAQTVTAEVDFTAGVSTDETRAGSVQARLFGASATDWRFYLEATAAGTKGTNPSDAFVSAYPYDRRLRPMELFGEKLLRPGRALVGLKAGRFRTPFGMAGRSDHAYSGFLRAPLIRYGTNFALSNTFLESGGELLVGVPQLYVQTTLGVPNDEGAERRKRGLDTVVRAQGYYRDLIVGASYLHTKPSDRRSFVSGRMIFRGVDARWMRGGVEVRGEWIDGRPFSGVATRGGYLDTIVHKPAMGPVTAVARVERLDYDAGRFSAYYRRLTLGARVRVTPWLVAQTNFLRQPGQLAGGRDHALDVAFTFSHRF